MFFCIIARNSKSALIGYFFTASVIEQAVRRLFYERQRGQQRLDALRRIGQAVDQAGLYERVLIPSPE